MGDLVALGGEFISESSLGMGSLNWWDPLK